MGGTGVFVPVGIAGWWLFGANYTVHYREDSSLFVGEALKVGILYCIIILVYAPTIRYLYIGGYNHAASPAWRARFLQDSTTFFDASSTSLASEKSTSKGTCYDYKVVDEF